MLVESEPVTAAAARWQILAALAPLALVADSENQELSRLLIQDNAVRLIQPATADAPAEDLGAVRLSAWPDGGQRLRNAVQQFEAAILSALPAHVAAKALSQAAAFAGRGGFVVDVDLDGGTVRLLLAAPYLGIADAVELGRIAEPPGSGVTH
jgi:hypothetical protein